MDSKQDNGIVSVLADFDNCVTELEEIRNLLVLFDQLLLDDISNIDPQETWTLAHFKSRFSTTHSMLSVSLLRLREILDFAASGIGEGLRRCRESTPPQAESAGRSSQVVQEIPPPEQ